MGDPNISLIGGVLQQAGHINADITAMRGGGSAQQVGGAPEDVSLYNDALKGHDPVPIIPTRGGGSTQQVGGANIPTFTLKEIEYFRLIPDEKAKSSEEDPDQKPILLTKKLVNKYKEKRKKIWKTFPSS